MNWEFDESLNNSRDNPYFSGHKVNPVTITFAVSFDILWGYLLTWLWII
jgi:hypothetical protein